MSADAAFRAAFDLHLRRRRLAVALEGGRRGGRRALAVGVLLLALVVLGVLPPPGGPFLTAALLVSLLAAGAAWGVGDSLRREGTADGVASALDGALGGQDLVPAAVALAARDGTCGRFGAALLERATAEVAGLAPERIGPLPRPPWRLLGAALLVAVLAALLPAGGFGVIPGLGSGWGAGGRPRAGGAVFGEPGPKRGGTPAESAGERPGEGKVAPAPRPEDPKAPAGAAATAPPPPPERVADLVLGALARSYMHGDRVTLAARADGGPGAGPGTDLEMFLSLDGKPAVPEGVRRRLAAGGHRVWTFNLDSLADMGPALTPGKHRVAGEMRDASGRAAARAAPIEILIESVDDPGGKGAGGGDRPKPEPRQRPESPPPPAGADPKPKEPSPPPPPPAAGGGQPKPKEPSPPPPPSEFEEKVVRPLFGEGAEVEKKGKILVLDPDGNRGEAPRELPPEEALALVRTRAEDAARREGIDPRDAEAVRRYFEALRLLLEGKK